MDVTVPTTRLSRALWTALLAAWAVWKASTGIRENDTFWHLGLGRAVLREGARVVPEPWALSDFPGRCVVPEWLWDVATYALYQAGGYTALNAVLLGLAALVPIAIGTMLQRARPHAGFGSFALVSLLCTGAVSARLSERPDVLALTFIAATVTLAEERAVGGAVSSARGLLAVALTVLWAQLHGTFVLAPCIFGAYFSGNVLAGERREHLGRDALWLVAIGLACLSSAHGLGALGYVLGHTRGDAVRHIVDMNQPSWEQLNPRVFLFLPLALSLLVLGALGTLLTRRIHPGRLLLALGGAYIASTALRGTIIAAVLAAPWALDGAVGFSLWWSPERAPRLRGLLRWLVPLAGLWLLSAHINERYGPLLQFGLKAGNFPVAAARWLRRVPAQSRALTSYAAGAYLGFALDGRVRTFVDSRTPMYFGDLDYALSRDALATPADVGRAVRRFGFDVAVIRRDLPGCESVARSGLFEPVLVEPRHTLFVRRAGRIEAQPITTIEPCGMAFVSERGCGDAAAAERDIGTVSEFEATLAGYLRIERAVVCRLPLLDVVAFVPSKQQALGYEEQRRLVLAQALLSGQQYRGALDLLHEPAVDGFEPAVRLSVAALKGEKNDAGIVELLSVVAEKLGDALPPDLRGDLGASCLAVGDLDCARFHATRAAARGSLRAKPTLEALVKRDNTESRRRAAAAWLMVLSR